MHERKVEKRPHHFVGRLIEAPSKRPVCHHTRQRIGREGVGGTAKHVSRKLVKQNYKREGSFRAFFPCREFTSRCRLMQRHKPRPDSQVEIPNHRSGPASRQKYTTSADVTSLIVLSRDRFSRTKTPPRAVAQVFHRFLLHPSRAGLDS
jgi:hypothetical protein